MIHQPLYTIFEYIFWISLFIVFYTYLGYGILLWLIVKIKRCFASPQEEKNRASYQPNVTLLIAAYNEESIIEEKMVNSLALDYPKEKLNIVWVTDGSNDKSNLILATTWKDKCKFYFEPQRAGKTAAINRVMPFINTPIVVFTDANTMLNKEAVSEIIKKFERDSVGCVAGEKRIANREKGNASASGEGFYWRYESTLKALDDELYSTIGAAGELFAIRRELFTPMEKDTLLDDFILSMKIAMKGYKIAYAKEAYATENGSANIKEEEKRKVRIAAGGLQSIIRLYPLLNIFKYGVLSFQYISHRVLRWTITPILLFLLLPINLLLIVNEPLIYGVIFSLQLLFYIFAIIGYFQKNKKIKRTYSYIPYYFTFMNINVLKGFWYLKSNKTLGVWEKSKRIV